MKTFREMVHCCLTAEYPDIPFRVRSTGHYKVTRGYRDWVVRREFMELYWCLEGEGQFIIDGKTVRLHPGEVCFYTSGDVHRISCPGEVFHYRWMAFDGAAAAAIWQGLHLTKTPHAAGCCPDEIFVQLGNEILDYSPDGLRRASATAFRILMQAAGHTPSPPRRYDYGSQARRIIDTQYSDPQINIGAIADTLGVDRSQLSRNFHARYGVSPVQYLINCRIQHGLALLENSRLQIKEIAARSGFNDPNYFSKAIKKYSGNAIREFSSRRTGTAAVIS